MGLGSGRAHGSQGNLRAFGRALLPLRLVEFLRLLAHVVEQRGVPGELLQARLAVHVGVEGALQAANGEGALPHDLAGPLDPLGLELRHGYDRVDEPHLPGLGRAVLPAKKPDLAGLLLPDDPGEIARPEAAVEAAHAGAHLAEDGVVGRDRQVADDVQHVPAADRVAGNQGNHDLRHGPNELLEVQDVEPRDAVPAHVPGGPPDALVAAGAKGVLAVRVRSGAGEEDDPDLRVLAGVGEGLDHLADGLGAERVALLRPVDRHLGDPVRLVVEDVRVGFDGAPGGNHAHHPRPWRKMFKETAWPRHGACNTGGLS